MQGVTTTMDRWVSVHFLTVLTTVSTTQMVAYAVADALVFFLFLHRSKCVS